MKQLFISAMFLALLTGCSSTSSAIYNMGDLGTGDAADTMVKNVKQKNLIIGAKLYADSKFSQKFFGHDLIYEGVIPILVALKNPADNNGFVIDPSKMTFTCSIKDSVKKVTLKSINITALELGAQIEKDIEPKLLRQYRLPPKEAKAKNGFVLFDARQVEGGVESLNLVDSVLIISVEKQGLDKPDKSVKGEDLSRYRGENLTFKILFN